MDYGIAQGLERATGNMANAFVTGMGIQANRAQQAEQMAFQREKFEEDKKTSIIQRNVLAEQEKALKFNSERLNVEDHLDNAGIKGPLSREFARAKMAPYWEDSSIVGADGKPQKVIQRQFRNKVLEDVLKNKEEQLEFDRLTSQDLHNDIERLKQENPEYLSSDDKKSVAVKQQIEKLKQDRDRLENHISEQKAILMKGVESTTDEMREYNLAVKQGETRSFTEWKKGFKSETAETWSEPYEEKINGKPVLLRKNLKTNKVEKIAEDVSTTVRINQSGNITEKDIVMPQLKALPKLKVAAQEANRKIALYNNLSSMVDKGAGGLVPGLKGMLSPALEALGMDSTIESEAQAYQLMARAGAGSMRMMLVGPGQVSNYEQDLMQRLSGGSIKTSRQAAKLLFKYYAAESKRIVDDYNTTVDDVSTVDPAISKVYKPIKTLKVDQSPKEVRTIVEQRKTKDGRILTKYSDGSIE